MSTPEIPRKVLTTLPCRIICLETLRISQHGDRQVHAINPHKGHIGRRVRANYFSDESPSILECDLDRRGTIDDVVVRHYVTRRIDYNTRCLTLERNDAEPVVSRQPHTVYAHDAPAELLDRLDYLDVKIREFQLLHLEPPAHLSGRSDTHADSSLLALDLFRKSSDLDPSNSPRAHGH